MSSFVGHTLTAGAVFLGRRGIREDVSRSGFGWLFCLWVAAVAPDFDYFLPFLHKSNHGGIRISNSIAYAMLIPLAVSIFMLIRRVPRQVFRLRSLQITMAGLSHIFLDYLVGVHPSPLFWPLSRVTSTSPVGVLASAGALDFRNYYLYRNLAIELGVFLPLYASILLLVWRLPIRPRPRAVIVVALLSIAALSVVIAANLSR